MSRFAQNTFGFGVTAEHGRRVLAQLRGQGPTEHDVEARDEHQAVVRALDAEREPDPEPIERAEGEPAHALSALADLTAAALGAYQATATLALLAAYSTEAVERAELADAWREAERCLGIALALATHHERAESARRTRGESPTKRERNLSHARLFLVQLRHGARRLVCDACETRRWPEPIGIDRLPRLP